MSAPLTLIPPAPEPRWYGVPADAGWSTCKCGKRQYWIETKPGKRLPVDCDVEGGNRPSITAGPNYQNVRTMGRGVSHFTTCPHANEYSHRGRS